MSSRFDAIKRRVLLTSFTTWAAHQTSNSSDDLVSDIVQLNSFPQQVHTLRRLPVDFELAPQLAIAQVNQLNPDRVVLCGMAERRSRLTVEYQAVMADETRVTSLDLHGLIDGLPHTDISYDAGRFVCNRLYYDMLRHLQDAPSRACVFVHVPVLTAHNRAALVADFHTLLTRILTT